MNQESQVSGTQTISPPQVYKHHRDTLPLNDTAWFGSFVGGLERGAIYLLGGSPGARKSGLALQLALDLARRGVKSLFLLTEEPAARLYDRAAAMMTDWPADDLLRAIAHISAEATLPPMRDLPKFVCEELLSAQGKYHGQDFRLVVVDSAQARGLSPAMNSNCSRSFSRSSSSFFSSRFVGVFGISVAIAACKSCLRSGVDRSASRTAFVTAFSIC